MPDAFLNGPIGTLHDLAGRPIPELEQALAFDLDDDRAFRVSTAELLRLALPMVVSQGTFAVMIFTDRYFMSQIDPVHMAAALGGGVASPVRCLGSLGADPACLLLGGSEQLEDGGELDVALRDPVRGYADGTRTKGP